MMRSLPRAGGGADAVDLISAKSTILGRLQTIPAGETVETGAEGETAPETLRQKDRRGMRTLESSGAVKAQLTDGVSPAAPARTQAGDCAMKSLRFRDRGGSNG